MEAPAPLQVSADAAPRFWSRHIPRTSEELAKNNVNAIAQLPCGHQVPSDYLISWTQYEMENGQTMFRCPTIQIPEGQNTGAICRTTISYQNLSSLVLLKPNKQKYFEETISELAAMKLCDYKECPGCNSFVERADHNNLCVHCTVCTSNKCRTYQFCWQCLREWRGPHVNAKHCANEGCGHRTKASLDQTSSLKLCKPAFKRSKIQTEKDDIYTSLDKSSRRTRLALILNNVEFDNPKLIREGAEVDERDMKLLLEDLGYSVMTLRNMTSAGMEAALADFSKRQEHLQSDSCFVVLMSHGTSEGACGVSYPENENDILPIDAIFHHLNTKNCPALQDKPKAILIQTCRGEEDGEVWVSDAVAMSSLRQEHIEKDFICLRSCTPNTISYRNPEKGSSFIQEVVKILNSHAYEEHIDELFRKVQKAFKDINPKQMPCKDRTTLLKKFYLFPGL